MTDLPTIRIRAMSTSENVRPLAGQQPSSSSGGQQRTDAPLFEETSLKYLESQLSPESLLMEDTTASEDDSTWMMSDLMIEAGGGQQSPPPAAPATASPPETPDPASLSPPLVLYENAKLSSCCSMGDFLTRTKNPVLPSVYIDNSLIVPEPSKQKYQNSNPSGFTIDDHNDVDLDYFDAFDAEIFPVWELETFSFVRKASGGGYFSSYDNNQEKIIFSRLRVWDISTCLPSLMHR